MGNPLASMGPTLEERKQLIEKSDDSLTKWQQVINREKIRINV